MTLGFFIWASISSTVRGMPGLIGKHAQRLVGKNHVVLDKNRNRLIIATSFLIPYHADTKKASKRQDTKNVLFF